MKVVKGDASDEELKQALFQLGAEAANLIGRKGLKQIAFYVIGHRGGPTQKGSIPFFMYSSDLPLWNKEIEAANVIEADAQYIKDSRINPEGLRYQRYFYN